MSLLLASCHFLLSFPPFPPSHFNMSHVFTLFFDIVSFSVVSSFLYSPFFIILSLVLSFLLLFLPHFTSSSYFLFCFTSSLSSSLCSFPLFGLSSFPPPSSPSSSSFPVSLCSCFLLPSPLLVTSSSHVLSLLLSTPLFSFGLICFFSFFLSSALFSSPWRFLCIFSSPPLSLFPLCFGPPSCPHFILSLLSSASFLFLHIPSSPLLSFPHLSSSCLFILLFLTFAPPLSPPSSLISFPSFLSSSLSSCPCCLLSCRLSSPLL